MTLAVRLGKKGAFRGLITFFVLIYASILCLIVTGLLSPWALLSLISMVLVIKLIRIIRSTDDWVLLDLYGKYVRMVYFVCGLAITAGILSKA